MLESEVEKKLKGCWHKLLGEIRIKPNDSFFSLGGDSLLFIALISKLEILFSMDCSDIKLQSILTFDAQLKFIKNKLNIPSDQIVVKLQSGNPSLTIIFIHPIGGTLFIYIPLIKKLNTPYLVLGIQDRFVVGDYSPYNSLDEQIDYYISQLKKELISENIVLIGHSSGGSLAFEICRQLIQEGFKIEHLIMFDSWARVPFDIKFRDCWQSIILRQINIIRPYDFLSSEDHLDFWIETLWNRLSLLYKYKAKFTDVNATLFIPLEPTKEYQLDTKLSDDWHKFVKNLTVYQVRGNHETMLNAKFLDELSEKIMPLLSYKS